MSETRSVIEVYNGGKIFPLGTITLKTYSKNDEKSFDVEFVIIKENLRPILGFRSLITLGLLKLEEINTLTNEALSSNKNNIIKLNLELFQGVGEFKEPLELRIQPGAQPVVRPPRRVPHALMGRLAEKLRILVEHKVIAEVAHPRSFVSNLVIIEKKDGSLRICLDPKDLNKVLIREHCLIPTLDEIVSKLCNKTYFSVLDLSDGFYNIKLSENSSDLCTFNSPFGCYKFLRCPFGISVAPEVFQRYSETAFGDIPGVIVYCDDLLICGDTEEEHDAILNKVFERAKEHNVRFNKNKFQYKLKEVKYFGHIFSEEGMKIDPERVNAITNMKSPTNKKELQIFLGMVNYLRKFIPNLANIASSLQLLLKKDVTWLWTKIHEDVFETIKKKLTEAPTLQNFNHKLPVVIQCDASKDGLGCCLMQEGKPVAFASRSLTPSEQNFSQIEKELLSVCWSTQKYHYYIYGQKCTIINDHKPLESLLKKHIHEVPSPRLQRMKLRLLKYDIEYKYLKGKYMYIADLLSRAYIQCDNTTDDPYINEMVHCVGLASHLQCTPEQKQELITESNNDTELSKLIEYTKNGWPDKKHVSDSLQYYYKFRSEITVDEGLVFLNHRIIIPTTLRLNIMKMLHEGHLGTTKMKQTARNMYYWPKIDEHLDTYVRRCFVCQTYQNNNVKEPLLPHEVPKLPFNKIATDIMEFKTKSYLVVYDYYSKWLDIKLLTSKSAKCIINSLTDVFCNWGIPNEVVSDHVPFDSRECHKFAREWGFTFTYTSPRYAQSNGMAEKGVQIAKKILLKCYEDKTDFRLALLQYRASPVSGTSFSPSQLMMNRNIKTKAIVNYKYLEPKLNNNVEKQFQRTSHRNKKCYNSTARCKNDFYVGQHVWFKKEPNKKIWLQGKICKCNGFRSYNVVDNNNVEYTRTSFHIRPA